MVGKKDLTALSEQTRRNLTVAKKDVWISRLLSAASQLEASASSLCVRC